METVHVKIADLAVKKHDGILATYGLGSCVGIALYDPKSNVGGLAHVLLNDSSNFIKPNVTNVNLAKFADTAIPHLVEQMMALGAKKQNLTATIAGGASLFNFKTDTGNVGEKNVKAVKLALQKEKIKIISEEVGGSCGRTMRLFVNNGEISITTAGKGAMKS
ncbi:MAG: chemotaxis protein CheD [Bacillota bacterium]